MANSWGGSGTTWGQGDWGDQTTTTVTISGLSITATLGEAQSYPEQGWGSDSWGSENWGESGIDILPTGYSITASLGTLDYAGSLDGWGRDEWGIGDWGRDAVTIKPDGFEISGQMGPDSWSTGTWGDSTWGGQPFALTTTADMAIGVSGYSITGSLGTPQINHDFIFTLSESLLGTLSLGALSINNGADHTQGLGGIAITGSLGTPTHEMKYELTGLSATMSLDTVAITSTTLVPITASLLATGSVGSVTVSDMAIGVSGYSITGSVGSVTVTDMQIGITGFEVTGNLGSGGVSPLGYKDVDITGNTSYTYIEHSA